MGKRNKVLGLAVRQRQVRPKPYTCPTGICPIANCQRSSLLPQAHKQRVAKNISSKFKHSKKKASPGPLHAVSKPLRSPATSSGGGGELRGEVLQVHSTI